MIARLWRTRVEPSRVEDYERFGRDVSLPMFRRQPGIEAVMMFRRGEECLVLTLWRDRRAIDALERSRSYRETVARILDQGFLEGEQSVETFDVHLAWSGADDSSANEAN